MSFVKRALIGLDPGLGTVRGFVGVANLEGWSGYNSGIDMALSKGGA
jgi:hypothetical protein